MENYNLALVALSYALSVFGSYTALTLASAIPLTDRKSPGWLIGAAFALGGTGIWAMHFVGMLAFKTPLDFGYDLTLTLASLAIAVVVVGIGLLVVSRNPSSVVALVLAGVITGLGVATMHYTGMAAMVMPGSMSHDAALVVASVFIAVSASIVALWLAFNVTTTMMRVFSALIMGVAVCGMHYTGMYAMNFDFGLAQQLSLADLQYQSSVDAGVLAMLIAVVGFGGSMALFLGTRESLKQLRQDAQWTN